MAATAPDIHYAPEDPTLPKPWKGLVDGKTGYLYFWNPKTNATQYERPVASINESSVPAHKSLSSSVQNSPQVPRNAHEDDERYAKASNGSTRIAEVGNYQVARSRSNYSQSDAEMKNGFGHGSLTLNGGKSSLFSESYCRRHEISVTGDNVSQPFTTFEATGFPSEILREGAIFAPGGAKCRTLMEIAQ